MKLIMVTLCLIVCTQLQAQKIHAFTQRIVPGTRSAVMDKDGNVTVEKKKELWKQMIYLEIPKGKKFQVTEVWMNGERYGFDTVTVYGPITEQTGITVPGHQEKILIPETKNPLILIVPKEKTSITEKGSRKVTTRKKMVVYYIKNGKTCYRSTNKIVELPEMLMQ